MELSKELEGLLEELIATQNYHKSVLVDRIVAQYQHDKAPYREIEVWCYDPKGKPAHLAESMGIYFGNSQLHKEIYRRVDERS